MAKKIFVALAFMSFIMLISVAGGSDAGTITRPTSLLFGLLFFAMTVLFAKLAGHFDRKTNSK